MGGNTADVSLQEQGQQKSKFMKRKEGCGGKKKGDDGSAEKELRSVKKAGVGDSNSGSKKDHCRGGFPSS